VTNPRTTPADIVFTLFDMNGDEQDRYEQIVPAGSQREWSLADLFNMQKFRGSVRIWSDVPIALGSRRTTTTLRGEPTENEIGYIDVASLRGKQRIEFPAISEGAGVATEIFLVNPTSEDVKGQLKFISSGGTPSEVALR
jgi:hypothetical protein